MSRRNTFPSLSSSRQMMMAWKVSGLSHRPAIMASRPASMRLAMAISPSRERSSSRAHFAHIHADGVVGALGWCPSSRPWSARLGLDLDQLAFALLLVVGLLGGGLFFTFFGFGVLGLDHVDTHLAEYRQDVFDLLGLDLLRGQQRVDLVVRDIAALLGAADQRP